MRRIARLSLIAAALLLTVASNAAATTITNGTVKLGINPQGDLNARDDAGTGPFGVTYVPTGNDGTRQGCLCEGWGAGAGGPVAFSARANQARANVGYQQVSFTRTESSAVSVVDITSGAVPTPTLRLT